MNVQLHLEGVPPAAPHAVRLTERQRNLLHYMRWVSHYGSPIATREARRFYADPHGALRRLERIGLVRHCIGRGCWKPT